MPIFPANPFARHYVHGTSLEELQARHRDRQMSRDPRPEPSNESGLSRHCPGCFGTMTAENVYACDRCWDTADANVRIRFMDMKMAELNAERKQDMAMTRSDYLDVATVLRGVRDRCKYGAQAEVFNCILNDLASYFGSSYSNFQHSKFFEACPLIPVEFDEERSRQTGLPVPPPPELSVATYGGPVSAPGSPIRPPRRRPRPTPAEYYADRYMYAGLQGTTVQAVVRPTPITPVEREATRIMEAMERILEANPPTIMGVAGGTEVRTIPEENMVEEEIPQSNPAEERGEQG